MGIIERAACTSFGCACRMGLFSLLTFLICQPAWAAGEVFPSYDCIQPNVVFWKRIYTEFDSNQGVLHDKYRLEIIYDVIELKPSDTPAGRQINRRRIQQAKENYRSILTRLSLGNPPATPVEKRVQRLFADRSAPVDFKAAIGHLRCQVGQKDRFRAGLVRSGAYIEAVKQIFRERGLPEALAYLPHVESSYHPRAHSKSGAVGIWQFTRATGREYLTIGPEIDERWDPLAASRGAAKLLHRLHRKFQSWPLAITAYNHGTAGMLRAQRHKGDYETIFRDYRSRRFRFASRNFYAEFLAARHVAENYRSYFGELALDRPAAYREIRLTEQLRLPNLIDRLGIDRAATVRLNPALRTPVVKGQAPVPEGFTLRLPPTVDRQKLARLESYYEAEPVAETGARSTILPRVRAAASVSPDRQTYGNAQVAEIVCPSIPPAQFALVGSVTENGRLLGILRVEVEETIGHYAEWLEVPVAEIRRLNGLPFGRALRISQRLRLPLHRVSGKEFEIRRRAYHEGLAEEFFSTHRIEGVTTYTVKKGDNIWQLATRKFNVPLWLIKRYNSETDFGVLTPAHRLRIPIVARDV